MLDLKPHTSTGGLVIPLKTTYGESGWRLEIPPGPEGNYRLSQLDDYARLDRMGFPHTPPLTLKLSARASSTDIPGTWGFGLWNDPFSISLGMGGGVRRFPSLPNTAWFFYASKDNYLSFQDDKPACGFLAQTFQSPPIPTPALMPGTILAPLLFLPPIARLLRVLIGRIIKEDSVLLPADPTQWHSYALHWKTAKVIFFLDGKLVFETKICPGNRLGLVIWIDNQYAAFPPHGKLAYGTLESTESAWIEVKGVEMKRPHH